MKIKIVFEPGWRSRPYPWWFNRKLEEGFRRISIPFFRIDLRSRRNA